jgi:hypothetical protein
MSATSLRERAILRGRLLERIAQQREALRKSSAPLCTALKSADCALEGAERARRWIAQNPLAVGVGVLVFVIWRPKGAFKLLSKGLIGWRTWRALRQTLATVIT